MGDVQATASPQQGTGHPTAIMRLSALAETEGIVYAGCGLRLEAQLASQKGRIVLGNLHGLGLSPETSQQTQSRQRGSHPQGQSIFETPCLEIPGRDTKQELWGKLD